MSVCKSCGMRLNKARWADGRKYKSCPRCSTKNGREHVFYPYPQEFGNTDKRVTANNPDGAQSYCTPCRSGRDSQAPFMLCHDMNDLE